MTVERQSLIVGAGPPVYDPPWDAVERAARNVTPKAAVILHKPDGRHIRADGARLMHTIVFYRDAKAPAVVVGRRGGGRHRGRYVFEEQRILVSPLEYWGQDGLDVFRAFYDDRALEDEFLLRDLRQEYSDEQIRRIASGGLDAWRGGRTSA